MKIEDIDSKSNWNPKSYSTFLIRKGFKWPVKESSNTYITMQGQTKYISSVKPFLLVVYSPFKKEYETSTKESALKIVETVNPIHWQLINLNNGKIIMDATY